MRLDSFELYKAHQCNPVNITNQALELTGERNMSIVTYARDNTLHGLHFNCSSDQPRNSSGVAVGEYPLQQHANNHLGSLSLARNHGTFGDYSMGAPPPLCSDNFNTDVTHHSIKKNSTENNCIRNLDVDNVSIVCK